MLKSETERNKSECITYKSAIVLEFDLTLQKQFWTETAC